MPLGAAKHYALYVNGLFLLAGDNSCNSLSFIFRGVWRLGGDAQCCCSSMKGLRRRAARARASTRC